MLALEIELLTGVYRAGLPDGSGAEWPPHPERVFSALVQAWGDGGCDPGEREALEWLENLGAPQIEADPSDQCDERTTPTVFVPPNDPRGNELAVLPERRRRQARTFRAIIPTHPTVRFAWSDAAPSNDQRTALASLARRVASLGHSSSFARVCFVGDISAEQERRWQPAQDGASPLRVPHRGRLKQLEEWLANGEWPRTGMAARYRTPQQPEMSEPVQSVFGDAPDWFVFEDDGGMRPDILGFAHVAKRVRAALMELGPQPPHEIVSGHKSDGAPTSAPHLSIVPLMNVGWRRSTGDLLGFAIVLPRGVAASDRRPVLQALAEFAGIARNENTRVTLHLTKDVAWTLTRSASPSRASLQPGRWCRPARIWASATPLLLDRFPDHGDVLKEARLIAAACRNIGLPEPVEIEIHKHSALEGAPSAYPARGNRRRPDWSFPQGSKFSHRPRRHVMLRFADRVAGPVIIGAGRFHGFGLCLPLGVGLRR
ncbi:MAG: type I-U CRISPR-associated protein Csb2 [Alphaproteobacteria bacterium]